MTNTKRSAVLRIQFGRAIGTGTFYANEAPLIAEKIERRDDKVLFEWKEGGNIKRVLIPNQRSILEEAEKAFVDLYVEPSIRFPLTAFDSLEDLLITQMAVKENDITLKQERSDGTVTFENVLKIGKGLMKAEYPETATISIFTNDLLMLKDFVKTLEMSLDKDKPISLKGTLTFGTSFKGLVSDLRWGEV